MPEWSDSQTASLLEESTEDLYEHAPCGYLSLLADGTIGKVNATFLTWTGYRREMLVGRVRFIDLLTVGGRIYFETHFQPLLRMQGRIREIALDVTRHDGSRLPVLVNATRREHADAGTAVTRITVFDATDRRQYERELLAARRRAEEAAQQRTELISTISHDIRAPLTAMTTAIALLEKSSPTPSQAKYIRVLQSSTAHALSLVNNLLNLSRLESGRTPLREQPFSIRTVTQEIAGAARAAALGKPHIDVVVRVDEGVPDRLLGDAAQIGQVMANLMMNAVKFTDRGFVSLIVGALEAAQDRVTLEVVVTDTGIGIAADRLPHIFDEFTQANEDIATKYGGTGLGLAISRKILRLYESDLTVTSTPGQGTTFSFPLTLKRPPDD